MKGPTQAELLQTAVSDAGVTLFHDAQHRAYATFPLNGHVETWALRSADFRRFLSWLYFRATGSVVRREVIAEQLEILHGKALFDGPRIEVHVRLAPTAEGLILDLGGEDWSVIEITPTGWDWLPVSPVPLVRPAGLTELPTPERDGSIDLLRPFLNVTDDDRWRLLVGFLVSCFHPSGPFGVLGIHGEQGAAKSTTMRVLRSLVDPRDALDRTAPREERDLAVHASRNLIIALDNLSSLPDWLSDALARMATGAGFSTRQLYSDDEEITFSARRPIMLNGIGSIITRSDLLDRALLVNLDAIPPDRRREESTFWSDFEQAAPLILGALLDAVSMALARHRTVNLPALPRMADLAKWVTAAEPALGWEDGSFLNTYFVNRGTAHELAIEADPVAAAIIEFMKVAVTDPEGWEGTPSALLQRLSGLVSEQQTKQRDWPKAAHALSNRLQRVAPNLRGIGIEVEFDRSGSKGRTVKLRRTASPASPASPPERGSDASDASLQPLAERTNGHPPDEEMPFSWALDDEDEDVLAQQAWKAVH